MAFKLIDPIDQNKVIDAIIKQLDRKVIPGSPIKPGREIGPRHDSKPDQPKP